MRGINIGWFGGAHGHDLGPNAARGWNDVWATAKPSAIEQQLSAIARAGFNAARIWIFEDLEGLNLDKSGIIHGINEEFERNLSAMTAACARHGLKILACMLQLQRAILRSGIPDAIADAHQREAYLRNALVPAVQILAASDTLYAVDLYNEPEQWVRDRRAGELSWNVMREFLRACVASLKNSLDLKITCGSGYHDGRFRQSPPRLAAHLQKRYSGLGLDILSVHLYANPWSLPHASALSPDAPLLLGECAPANRGWRNTDAASQVQAYMDAARQRGYVGCFPWKHGSEAGDLSFYEID